MKVEELKKIIDIYIEQGKGKDDVVITLSNPSVGPRASTGISSIFPGFDWEQGQIRIEPKEKLITKDKDRDIPLPIKHREYNLTNKKRIVRTCPKCGGFVKVSNKYCPSCGQRISTK